LEDAKEENEEILIGHFKQNQGLEDAIKYIIHKEVYCWFYILGGLIMA